MSRKLSQLLVLSVLILGVFSFSQMIQPVRAATPGVVCIGPDLPAQTACPTAPIALTGPVSSGPVTQLRVQIFIQVTDPMNGFDITLLANHAVLVPAAIDLTGSILGAGPTVLAECLQGVLVAGSVCNTGTSDTIDTLHLAAVAAPGALPGGTTPPGDSGILFTAIYNIVSASTGTALGFQTDTNDGQTNCAATSIPGTCINISNGTNTPVAETAQTGTFTSSSTQPFLQLSPASTSLGNAFPGVTVPPQTITTTDMNGYGAWQSNGGIGPGDATISYTVTITPPSTGATGLSTGTLPTQDFSAVAAGGTLTNSLTITNGASTTPGLWTITVTGTYHFDPTCPISGVGCTGPASTLVQSITLSLNVEDFGITVNGGASNAIVPFWCPATAQGSGCPAGQSGVASVVITPKGYTGSISLANGVPAPATVPVLSASLSATTIPGASGTATDTFSGGLLRPTTTVGSYSVAVSATGTLAANGVFPALTKTRSVTANVRPQEFTLLASTGTSTGPAISFASGSSSTDLSSLASFPTGSVALNAAGFAGPVSMSSSVTGGTGLTVAFATSPVSLTGGGTATDLITFSGTVTTTTTFTVTVTGTASLATSNPGTQTHSITYSVTINGAAKDATSTSIACSPGSINPGQTSTCTATVTDTTTPTNIPSGTATFTLNAGTTGGSLSATSCTLDATGKCAVNFQSATAGGTATVGASYGGDNAHNGSTSATSATITVTVPAHPTSTSVVCSAALVVNELDTCTATVTDTSATPTTPTGTVSFAEATLSAGSFSGSPCTLAASTTAGEATCNVTFSSTATGGANVVGTYSGDSTHTGSDNSATPYVILVGVRGVSVTVSCTPNPITTGQTSQCTATVTDTSAGTPTSFATDTVSFGSSDLSATFTPNPCTITGTTATVTCVATYTPSAGGTATITAHYDGSATHAAVLSSGFGLTVTAAVTITTSLSQTTITVGGSVTDSAALSGNTATAGGAVTYKFFSGSSCSGTGTIVGSPVTVASGVVPNSASQAFNTAGSFSWNAVYSGDANNNGATSACEPLTVNPLSGAAITTTLSSTSIPVGSSVTDSATLTGVTSNAGGTVTYSFFTGSACAGTGTPVGTAVTVTGGVVPASSSQAFNSAGSFSWNAVYSGDTNNGGATSGCEPLTVNMASPIVSTILSSTVISAGGSVTDSATITGGFQASGTVTYSFFTGPTCTGTGTTVGTPVTIAGGIVPGSASQTFASAGSFSWNAVYSGDANNKGATSACEPLTVNPAGGAVLSTTLSATSITVGASVSDSATLAGVTANAGGTVTYNFFAGSSCTGTATPVGSPVTVTAGVVPSSASQAFNAAGAFSWNAVYSGDANNAGTTSGCEPLAVSKASATIATSLASTSINVGGSVVDSATLSGGFQVTGTVTYNFFTGSTCGGTATLVGSPVNISGGVVPNSASQTFNNAGSFSWNAVYSGDSNNDVATSACEPLTVNMASPTVTTTLSSNSINQGSSVTDSAALTNGFQAGGTVTYSFFSGATCAGTATQVGTPVTVTNGAVPSSASQTFANPGSFSWNAVYSGDANNNGATSACEPLTVNAVSVVTISTALSSNIITVGGSVTDSASLAQVTSTAGGTVTYSFFSGSSCTGTGTAVGSPVTVTNGLVPNSASQSFSSAGSFSWNAVYSGDSNNAGATSACETLTVNHATPTIVTTVSGTSVPVGTIVHDSATLSNGFNAGGTVTYTLFAGSTCSGAIFPSTVTVSGGIVPDSTPFMPVPAGSFSYQASYSGDANNMAALSVCEPFSVLKANPTISTSLSATQINVGGSVTDSATLSGSFTAFGTVSYNLFSTIDCSGSSSVVSTVNVQNNAVPNSASQTFNNAGSFGWTAFYSGDANNTAATSACEPLTVAPSTGAAITTSLSSAAITVGGSVFDTAKLTGVTASAGGTVSYSLFNGTSCGSGRTIGTVAVVNGVVPDSASATFMFVGGFSWNAAYSGDANNNPAVSACEPLIVNQVTPSISTSLSASQINVGQSVTDSATLSNSFQAGGFVTYRLFGAGDCSGTGTIISNVTVTNGVVPNSASRLFNTTGTFGWNAAYSGDANNMGATSACEPLTVSSVTGAPFLLTFQAFNFTAFHNGIGPFTVLVNGHVVVVFPGHGFVSTSSTVVFGTDKWVNLGPYDITAFVIPGQNNVTFVNTFGLRFSLIRNVTVTQGNTVFLNFAGPRFVSPARSLTLTFSNPPLVITSFTVTGNLVTDNLVTFTATYTGGTGPFKCIFFFGDDEASFVVGGATSCSVTHDFDDSGNFTAHVLVIGSSTSDFKLASLNGTVTESTLQNQQSLALATVSSTNDPDDD